MQLEDLIPEKPKFFLGSTGTVYELRPPNIEDRMDMPRMVSGGDLIKVFNDKKWDEICKIVYRLLIDKKDFLATKETRINDDGIEETVLVTGPIKLLRAIQTQTEAIQMLGALTSAIAAGEPLVKKFLKEEVKKSLLNGESFLTSSPPSTDTLPSNSESLPSAS